ncbi:MAG: hypothetical protein RBS95_08640 [Desulfobulbus sp.]|nr:hypothetical protein [Desulfobulbus sp.]
MATILTCLLAGMSLILVAADSRAWDYPLIRTEYRLLLGLSPVLLIGATLQASYLLALEPDIITSCCAIVFNPGSGTVAATFLQAPRWLSQAAFAVSAVVTLAAGFSVYRWGRGAVLFAIASGCHFLLSLHALIAFISLCTSTNCRRTTAPSACSTGNTTVSATPSTCCCSPAPSPGWGSACSTATGPCPAYGSSSPPCSTDSP